MRVHTGVRRFSFTVSSICLAALILGAGSARASQACDQMRGWLNQGGGSASGLIVVEAESGEVVCGSQIARPRSLASNMKLFTTSTALGRLGPETRIATKVLGDGKLTDDGVFHGSLYLQGGGDPTLGTPGFYNAYLSGVGTNLFALRRADPRRRDQRDHRPPLRRRHDLRPPPRRRRLRLRDQLRNRAALGPRLQLRFRRRQQLQRLLLGPGQTGRLQACPLADAGGVEVPQQVALAATPATARPLAVVRSPTLTRIVNFTDVYSYNFFAEMLIKLIGAEVGERRQHRRRGRPWSAPSPAATAPASTPSTAPA